MARKKKIMKLNGNTLNITEYYSLIIGKDIMYESNMMEKPLIILLFTKKKWLPIGLKPWVPIMNSKEKFTEKISKNNG